MLYLNRTGKRRVARKIISSLWTAAGVLSLAQLILFFQLSCSFQHSCNRDCNIYCSLSFSKGNRDRASLLTLHSVAAKAKSFVAGGGATNYRRQQQQSSATTQDQHRRKSQMTLERAILVEEKLLLSLEHLQQCLYSNNSTPTTYNKIHIVFPTTRECNAAIATFGNNCNFFTRSLQLFVKMRKIASLTASRPALVLVGEVPAPTLVTYSTLMSRAVSCDKPQVALRLWKLMTLQSDFFTNDNKNNKTCIVPDTRAANILMNAYAKLGDVDSAKTLLQQMLSDDGGSKDVPKLQPNLITYNTLIDACRRAGDLKTGLHVLQDMKLLSDLQPDVRTYTSLIATVARRSNNNNDKSLLFGTKDPDMAFALLNEMIQEQNLRPNGMTFCALIDVCGRCGRVDLALVGLRIMLRLQKDCNNTTTAEESSSVGAWTAAINACGKAGRYNTAVRLFQTMENFGAKPNIVTCGCLVDCLLRAKEQEAEDTSSSTVETLLQLLRYMKENNMEPTEVMYTSLIASAGRLVRVEVEEDDEMKRKKRNVHHPQQQIFVVPSAITVSDNGTRNNTDRSNSVRGVPPRAIDTYTELLKSMSSSDTLASQSVLLKKVFLVFHEMKEAGGKPDVACYNSLLRACARAGDVTKSQDVLREMLRNGFLPNDVTWKQLIKAAARSKNSQVAQQVWNSATNHTNNARWKPDMEAFEALIGSYWGEAFITFSSSFNTTSHRQEPSKSFSLLRKVIELYTEIQQRLVSKNLSGKNFPNELENSVDNKNDEFSNLHIEELHGNIRLMLMILHSAVSMELMLQDDKIKKHHENWVDIAYPRKLAIQISTLPCIRKEKLPTNLSYLFSSNTLPRVKKSLELARAWAKEESPEPIL